MIVTTEKCNNDQIINYSLVFDIFPLITTSIALINAQINHHQSNK